MKKVVDNFEEIIPHLHFDNEDDFYFLQILKRKKENPEVKSNAETIATYYVTSKEHLQKLEGEIKNLCDYHNARAYLNLNRRSFEQMAFHTLKKITDQILNKDYRSCRKAYNSVAGSLNKESGNNKKWVIDIDSAPGIDLLNYGLEIDTILKQCEPVTDDSKILFGLPTKNGIHIITCPFNVKQFEDLCRGYVALGRIPAVPDIQKNNPTILYMPV